MKSSNVGAAGGLVISSLSAAAAAFFVNVLSARALGPELRGTVAFVLQLSYFVAPILLLGVERRILRAGRAASREDTVPANSVALLAGFAILICGSLAGVSGAIAVLVAIVSVLFGYARAWNVAKGQTVRYVYPFVAYQFTMVAGSLGLFLADVTFWPAWAIVYVFPGLAIAAWQVRRLIWVASNPLLGVFRALRLNGNYMVASLSVIATTRFERLILPLATSPRELGIYIVVATASEPVFWFAQALSDVRVGAGKRSAFSRRAILFDLLIFSIAGALGGTAINYLLVPIFGEQYEAARELICPLIISSVVLALYRQLSGKLLLSESSRVVASSEVVTAIVAVVLYTTFVLVFKSALGAAWGSVAVYFAAIVVLGLFAARRNRGSRGGGSC